MELVGVGVGAGGGGGGGGGGRGSGGEAVGGSQGGPRGVWLQLCTGASSRPSSTVGFSDDEFDLCLLLAVQAALGAAPGKSEGQTVTT